MDKSIIEIIGFVLSGIGSVIEGILIILKIFPAIDNKQKIKQIDFFKFLGGTILLVIGAILFFYARNRNLDISKILFYSCFAISFLSFLYTNYNSSIVKNIEEKEILIPLVGLVLAIIGVTIFIKNGYYMNFINNK